MRLKRFSRITAAAALVLATGTSALAATPLATSGVFSASGETVFCSVSNLSTAARQVSISFIGHNGNVLVGPVTSTVNAGGVFDTSTGGLNDFFYCKFDVAGSTKYFRGALWVISSGVNTFFSEAR